MVTGSMAVNYYAVPRMTRDIGIVISKLDWARDSRSEVQLRDVRNLLAAEPDLDRQYLARWVGHLGLDSLYREVAR